MKIAIIGTGNIGSTLASGWAKAGHKVFLGVRNIENFKGNTLLSQKNITAHTIPEAIGQAEVVLLSVPPNAIPSVANFLKGAEEKVIIDPTNSFNSKPEGYENGFKALTQLTECKHIVKGFNTTGFENLANPIGLDTFVSGDSEKAKSVVKRLSKDLGFAHCYDFGGNDQATLQEQLGLAWINLAIIQGLGRNIYINVLKR